MAIDEAGGQIFHLPSLKLQRTGSESKNPDLPSLTLVLPGPAILPRSPTPAQRQCAMRPYMIEPDLQRSKFKQQRYRIHSTFEFRITETLLCALRSALSTLHRLPLPYYGTRLITPISAHQASAVQLQR